MSHYDFCAKFLGSDALVLDVGSGKGKFLVEMAKRGFSVYGVETNPDYIRQSQERAGEAQVSIHVVESPGERLSFGENYFEFVNCAEVTEHVENPKTICTEIYRVLKPGGSCYISFHNRFGFFDYHYRWPFINWLPRHWSSMLLKILGKEKVDSTLTGRQKLSTMHYFTFGQLDSILEEQKFTIQDVREEKIKQKFSFLSPIFLFFYRVLLRPFYFNSFHIVLKK